MAESQRSGAFAVVCGVVGVLALLVVTGVAASRTTTTTASTAVGTGPTPTTTMEAVRPAAEDIAPQAAAGTTLGAETPGAVVSGPQVSGAWVTSVSQKTGIGKVAVAAYGTAALRLAGEQASCKLGWTTLAGIGGIESGHGTNGGATLLDDGTTSQRILGPALDGSAGMAAIPSDDDSAGWHGDARWDHAVGPMQFIPSTWRTWGSDGNGDGQSDPNNVYDAAYAAARYLCASGGDLTTGQGWTQAVFSYNHSDDYVRSVLARANSYAGAR